MGEEALNPSSLPQNSLRSLGPSPLRRLRRHLPQHSLRSLGEETETGLRSLGEETETACCLRMGEEKAHFGSR